MVVALRDGVYWFDPRTEALTLLCRPEPDLPQNRMNDGKVGPDGRFWVGSMDDRPEKEAIASLYRIDTTGRCDRMVGGLIVSNGPRLVSGREDDVPLRQPAALHRRLRL